LQSKTSAIVFDEDHCAYGPGANKCLRVEPLNPVVSPNINGIMGPSEYRLATEVAFTNLGDQGSGRVYFAVDSFASKLRVFAQDIPLPPGVGSVGLFIDFDRFAPGSDYVTAGDHAFIVGVDTGNLVRLRPVGIGTATKWGSSTSGPPVKRKVANLRTSPSGHRRVDIELEVTLTGYKGGTETAIGVALATSAPAAGTPGAMGTFPEDNGASAPTQMWTQPNTPLGRRDRMQTLAFRSPPGNALTFMTWNVKRFTPFMQTLEDIASLVTPLLDTSGVSDTAIGNFIGDHPTDVVALQEVFRSYSAEAIQVAANQRRALAGLPPYQLVGPIDFGPSILTNLTPDPFLRQPDETQGGTYILTSRRVMLTGYRVFTACKGEDCLKAKGVLWARISTDPPDAGVPCDVGVSCPPKPSGDHFVDVFATHMNGPDPIACGIAGVATALSAISWNVVGSFFGAVAADNWHCTTPVDDVLRAQATEMSDFVDAVSDKARPSVLLGDFNFDGKDVNSTSYQDLITRLRVAPSTANTTFPAPDDMLNPWPSSWSNDLDHGDVARDTVSDWLPGDGTDIGVSGTYNDAETHRYDYILVRNPIDRAAMTQFNTRHIVRKGAGRVWASPWPGPTDQSSRLSDHKPVMSSLEFAPYYVPGAFHPTFEQDFRFAIASYDTTGIDDCWGCDELDVFARVTADRQQSGAWTPFAGFQTAECQDEWAANQLRNPCMSNWFWSDFRTLATTHYRTRLELWDHDSTSADDLLPFANESADPSYDFVWARGALDVRDPIGGVTYADWMKFYDVAPVQRCTRTTKANICLELSVLERNPYP
jgi:hypothetical protein